jgi:hypothetical protein
MAPLGLFSDQVGITSDHFLTSIISRVNHHLITHGLSYEFERLRWWEGVSPSIICRIIGSISGQRLRSRVSYPPHCQTDNQHEGKHKSLDVCIKTTHLSNNTTH